MLPGLLMTRWLSRKGQKKKGKELTFTKGPWAAGHWSQGQTKRPLIDD